MWEALDLRLFSKLGDYFCSASFQGGRVSVTSQRGGRTCVGSVLYSRHAVLCWLNSFCRMVGCVAFGCVFVVVFAKLSCRRV